MSIEAEQEMRLSAQLAADVSGVECEAMCQVINDEELKVRSLLRSVSSSHSSTELQNLLSVLTLCRKAIVDHWVHCRAHDL